MQVAMGTQGANGSALPQGVPTGSAPPGLTETQMEARGYTSDQIKRALAKQKDEMDAEEAQMKPDINDELLRMAEEEEKAMGGGAFAQDVFGQTDFSGPSGVPPDLEHLFHSSQFPTGPLAKVPPTPPSEFYDDDVSTRGACE